MVLDILKPIYYFLEKKAAGRIIPDVTSTPNRKQIKDYLVDTKSDTTNTNTNEKESSSSSSAVSCDHSLWNAVLQRHVSVQDKLATVSQVHVVDYAGVAADANFAAYLEQLAATDPDALAPLEQLAFWMNAYNALCINLIVKAVHDKPSSEPIRSINDLSAGGKAVWDQVAGRVHGQDITLNEIEHDRIRRQWAEPAIHACIVCASASCPNLRREAFVASAIREQMDDQMRHWLSNPSKGMAFANPDDDDDDDTNKHQNQLHLSRIFLWFEKDFGGWKGIRQLLPEYLPNGSEALQSKIRSGRVAVRYFDYDWSINRKGDP